MIDVEIILRPLRNWGMMCANSPDGRRWIIRHVGGVAATFPTDLLKAYLARAAESGITIKVSKRGS